MRKPGKIIDEEHLFREMAYEFNTSISKATYVEVIHKNYIEFISRYKVGGVAKVELGDLMLLTYDKATTELRICILQAKYRSKKYYYFLDFKADIFQWELLKEKPDVTNISRRFDFPKHILNFRNDYESITAYGIFYHDNISGDIDFLYTLPRCINPNMIPTSRVTKCEPKFSFRCPKLLGSPNRLCRAGIFHKETISSCSIDVFEQQVLRCKVGAPINDKEVKRWVIHLLHSYKGRATIPEVIDELLGYLNVGDSIEEDNYDFECVPSVLVVVTDSEKVINDVINID